MNGYISVREAAERWDISIRQVQKLCNEGRVKEAVQFASVWVIPEGTEKPTRTARSKPGPRPKAKAKPKTWEADSILNPTEEHQ